MLLSILYGCVRLLLDLPLVGARPSAARDVELLVLRHEVRVLRCRAKRARYQPGDRLVLAGLSRLLPQSERHRFPLRPETLLRWHRELARRKWAACGQRRGPGRPPLPTELRDLVLRLTRENPAWGYQRLRGELLKLGYTASATAIRAVLREHRVPPAPCRAGLSWQAFLRAQARGVLACDFFYRRDRHPPDAGRPVLPGRPSPSRVAGRLRRAPHGGLGGAAGAERAMSA